MGDLLINFDGTFKLPQNTDLKTLSLRRLVVVTEIWYLVPKVQEQLIDPQNIMCTSSRRLVVMTDLTLSRHSLPSGRTVLLLYIFDLTFPISFSSFIALPMSPLILSLPVMNADVAFSSPLNILMKSLLSILNTTSAVS